MADWLKLIPADEARRILAEIPPLAMESVPLVEAAGRVLGAALIAPHDLPPERRSAMDGYAVRASDVAAATPSAAVVLRVVGSVAAGSAFMGAVAPGEAVAIATGAVVPAGADAVVMVEITSPVDAVGDYAATGGRVRVTAASAAGDHIIRAGEDIAGGAHVLSTGRRLRPGDVAALASFGVVDVCVFRRPRIVVIATGSEICPPHEVPRPGQVRDSNQYVLAAEVRSAGGIAVLGGIVGDDADLLASAVTRGLAENDGVILSGGSSVGPKDLTGRVLRALPPPGVLFHGIDIRPGKPTVFARAGEKPVVGMPGYPTSSMVVFDAFVRPMLARLGGEVVSDAFVGPTRARLSRAVSKPASREDYLRVRLSRRGQGEDGRDGDVWADVLPGGSSSIANVIFADGLARIPAGVDGVAAGSWVGVRLFS